MSIQQAFALALLAPDANCPEGVFSSNGAEPASRFAVYRNNVHSALINALAAAYPVARQLVGEEFFRAMAGLYVQAHPPISPLISEYGSTFADFIQAFEPASSVPYLADVARLERLRVRAYHAADCQVLDQHSVLEQLQGLRATGATACTTASVTRHAGIFLRGGIGLGGAPDRRGRRQLEPLVCPKRAWSCAKGWRSRYSLSTADQ